MSTSRIRLQYLFNCYYNKTATPQERDELFAIIAAGKKDRELSDLVRDAWDELQSEIPVLDSDKSDQILKNILSAAPTIDGKVPQKKMHTLYLWSKLSAAAIGLIFVSFGIYSYLHQQKPVKQAITKVKPLHDALPGSSKAILTLANGKTIVLDDAVKGTLARQGNTLINKTAEGKLVYNLSKIADENSPVTINTIATPRGGEYQVVLPDGTKVWLNAASSLRFPTRFTGNARNVEITGEAYFEVTKNKEMPFKVKTNRAEIEVLGTHFNVMAYDDEGLMKTTLLEGAVNIKSNQTTNILKPGEQAQVTATGSTRITKDVDLEEVVAWKNGIFQFTDAGIDVILRQASRWYDLDVNFKNKPVQREFNGHISRNVKASQLLKMLNYSGVNLHIDGKTIIVE